MNAAGSKDQFALRPVRDGQPWPAPLTVRVDDAGVFVEDEPGALDPQRAPTDAEPVPTIDLLDVEHAWLEERAKDTRVVLRLVDDTATQRAFVGERDACEGLRARVLALLEEHTEVGEDDDGLAGAATRGSTVAPRCIACNVVLYAPAHYYLVADEATCAPCTAAQREARSGPLSMKRFARALLFGVGGGAVGAALFYATAALTGLELALFALLVGLLVGAGVRFGSRKRGGAGYQALAMILTYLAIVSTYVPAVAAGVNELFDTGAQSSALYWLLVFGIALAWPIIAVFFAGLAGLGSSALFAIALYEAWQLNRVKPFVVCGPFFAPSLAASETEGPTTVSRNQDSV